VALDRECGCVALVIHKLSEKIRHIEWLRTGNELEYFRVEAVYPPIDEEPMDRLFVNRENAILLQVDYSKRHLKVVLPYAHRSSSSLLLMEAKHLSEIELSQDVSIHHDYRLLWDLREEGE